MNVETQQLGYTTAASRWAGVGPYYAMFPVSFASTVIKEHTRIGESILDPFAGRGTSIFAAASECRVGIGIEINPVGWIYGKAKLQTAESEDVEECVAWLGKESHKYMAAAKQLPEFFRLCFCPEVRAFLLAARDLLDWRRRKTDWTTMALLMIDLHGKKQSALSNQMRQTKAMSPGYAVGWWRERGFKPPQRDPVDFMLKKVRWRFAKGRMTIGLGRVYLGDCQSVLNRWAGHQPENKASLLLTSPPYYGVTNYFYDQWLRLWLLGGPERPKSRGESCKRKFENKQHYLGMLRNAFLRSEPLLKANAVIHVRTDARQFTKEATIEALEKAFPKKRLRSERHTLPNFTQTSLFDPDLKAKGEVDLVMW
ncbi:MAG: DNA modification methylase [Acidobacteria bacterium]|nr:MAG: DNA modification methylase [Acidobacteriota bacterium]